MTENPTLTDPCPYPGLRAFSTGEQDWYFGRESHVDAMLTCLETRRFLAVIGSSGSGKSSLVFAGLIPALQEGQLAGARRDSHGAPGPWNVISFGPGNDPLEELTGAISKAAQAPETPHLADYVRAALLSGDCGLTEALNMAGLLDPHRETLVYADQFEELFRFGEKSSRAAQENAVRFAQLFVAAAEEPEVPFRILLSMRSEFIGECERFPGLPEIVSRSQFLTPRLSRSQLEQSLRCPAETVGWKVASTALTAILNDCGSSPDHLPLAQHILRRMWMRAANEGRKELTLDDYISQGGIKSSVARHGDDILGKLAHGGAEVARVLFMALCEQREDGPLVRRLSNRAEVQAIARYSKLVPEVIAAFSGNDPGFIYEDRGALDVRHEAVLRQWPQVSRWRAREAEARIWLKDLSQAASGFERDSQAAELWQGKDLRRAKEWMRDEQPSEAWARRHAVHNWDQCVSFLARSEAAERSQDATPRATHEERRYGESEIPRVGEYRPSLAVYVVWHPDFEQGRELADRIYRYYSHDSARRARGLGIPVFFRSECSRGEAVPPAVEVEQARHTAIIVLVDPEMVLADGWDKYVEELWQQAGAAPEQHRLFPVAFDDTAYQLSPQIGAVNFIRMQGHSPEAGPGFLLNRLTNELTRLITQRRSPTASAEPTRPAAGPARVPLFISYAKLDGEKTAILLRDYIHENLALDTFFDAIDIAAGFRFEDEINAGIDTATFVVVHTDAYASRVWCQEEVLRAKRHGWPLVVIHAIEEGEARSFPYIGNVPTIRWRAEEPARLEAVIGLVLREVLHAEYFRRHFDDLKSLLGVPDAVRALPRAPELLTCLALRAESGIVPYFVYPDPPLAKQELDLLTELDPNLRLTTPTLLFARPSKPLDLADQKALAGWLIGLSISDSADLAMRGFGPAHLRDTAAEFARFLLAAGATLAYGGDLRQGGFTEVLFELLTAYRAISGEAVDAIQSYLAWPIHLDLDVAQRARLKNTARFHPTPAPANLGIDATSITSKEQLPPTTPENRGAWARSLTAMREQMNAEIHARLLLGGQARGLGKYPGIAEEALLALRAGKPVYLIGAFGGCAEAVIEALRGNKPAALTLDYQAAETLPRATIELYNSQVPAGGEPIDYKAVTAEFGKFGVAGLNNGLDAEENERLFTTTNLPEMIALVLRGLGRLGKPPILAT